MDNLGSNGITSIIILIAIILAAITTVGIITGSTIDSSSDTKDIEELAYDVVNEISTYIQIKDQKGKYSYINNEYQIKKIAILVSPLFSQDIDVSQLMIQIDNGENVRILNFACSSKIGNNGLFEHYIWEYINGTNFGLISIIDIDNSISDNNIINQNTDNCYIVFELPMSMTMRKYQEIKVTLFPASGITRTVNLKAPPPIKSIITFE